MKNAQPPDKKSLAVWQLSKVVGVVLVFCSWSAFSWADHRESSPEPASASGGEPTEAAPAVVPPASSHAAVVTKLNELSGSAVFEDGLLIADDELVGMVLHVSEPSGEQLHGRLLKIERKAKDSRPNVDNPKLSAVQDFEGIASDGKRNIFFIGSHDPNDGKRRSDREFLIHAKWDDGELKWVEEFSNLAEGLAAPLEEIGVKLDLEKTTINPELNVEGLAWHKGQLYIGLREPLAPNGNAILVIVDESKIFKKEENARFEVRKICLSGDGIRSLDWDPKTERMLILSGPTKEEGEMPALLAYDIASGALETVHTFTEEELKRSGRDGSRLPEGVSRWNDKIVIAFDNETGDLPAELLYLSWP